MGGRRKKKPKTEKNRRLDFFLSNLHIEQEKKEKIIKYVEELTLNTLRERTKGINEPKLRLRI